MSLLLKLPFSIGGDHFTGSTTAALEVVQYGDFQCRHCGSAYTSIKLLRKHFASQLRFVFRHFPLPTRHPLSLEAAVASEVAALQGKFWDMYDLIFENQNYLVRSSFSRFAEELKLNTALFDDSRAYKNLVQKVVKDFESGVKSGVNCTPTFFINGRRHNGFVDFDAVYLACSLVLNKTSVQLEENYSGLSKMFFANA